MISMSKFGNRGSMVERAADRVCSSYLARQRAARAYKQHMKDASTNELVGDVVFEQLRNDMQTTKDNHISAQQSYEAVSACPPINA